MKLKKKIFWTLCFRKTLPETGIPTETPLARFFLTNFNLFKTTLKLGFKVAKYYISRPGVVTN